MKKYLMLTVLLHTAYMVFGQDDPKLKISGYLETYYGYDFNKPSDNNRPGFVYSHKRDNEINLNLGLIKEVKTKNEGRM